MPKQRLLAVHLLNDYSGSPLVFSQALEVLKAHFDIHLFTATPGGKGILSNISNITFHSIFYRWSEYKVVTLLLYLYAQATLFLHVWRMAERHDIVYINTLLPFGAAWAAKCKGCKVIYHVHETAVRPLLLKWLLVQTVNHCAYKVVYVSPYLKNKFELLKPEAYIIPNTLTKSFIAKAKSIEKPELKDPFTVLMLCSLKRYKGVYSFIAIARQLPHLLFMLVLNASDQQVEDFKRETTPPFNCVVYPAQPDTIPFYRQAHIVVNLSNPDAWIETFGMTILEAMYCGRPAIGPNVGGPAWLITDDENGLLVDTRDEMQVVNSIRYLANNSYVYLKMSEAARAEAITFSTEKFEQAIHAVFELLLLNNSSDNTYRLQYLSSN